MLAADGSLLAADDLAEPARALLAAAPEADDVEVVDRRGHRLRGPLDEHAVVLVCGRFALPSLMRFDLRLVLGDLAGERRDAA